MTTDADRIRKLQRKNREIKESLRLAKEALQMLYDETADYIRVNNLGDVHHNQSMKMARNVLYPIYRYDRPHRPVEQS